MPQGIKKQKAKSKNKYNVCLFLGESKVCQSDYSFIRPLQLGLVEDAEIYIKSAPNNSNGTYTFMCLGRAGHFGQC